MNTQNEVKSPLLRGWMKKISAALTLGTLAAGLLMVSAQKAHAVYSDSISSNDATAMVVRITPRADRGVEISTGNVNLNLGTVDLGASTQTVSPATVTITGNMSSAELDLAASITGGWSFDNNPLSRASTAAAANLLNVWATFTSVSTTTVPSQDDEYFRVGASSGAKITSASNSASAAHVGTFNGSGFGLFENNETAGDMDSMTPGSVRHLWTYFRLPPTTSITGPQDINFVLSVRAGD